MPRGGDSDRSVDDRTFVVFRYNYTIADFCPVPTPYAPTTSDWVHNASRRQLAREFENSQ